MRHGSLAITACTPYIFVSLLEANKDITHPPLPYCRKFVCFNLSIEYQGLFPFHF